MTNEDTSPVCEHCDGPLVPVVGLGIITGRTLPVCLCGQGCGAPPVDGSRLGRWWVDTWTASGKPRLQMLF